MPANLLPRVSDSVFALAALIVTKELLFFNKVVFYSVCLIAAKYLLTATMTGVNMLIYELTKILRNSLDCRSV